MKNKLKKKVYRYLFWLKSSRGTNQKTVEVFAYKPSQDELKSICERWCSNFACWEMSELHMTYGFYPIILPNRRKMNKIWDKVCDREKKANEALAIQYALISSKNKTPRKEP